MKKEREGKDRHKKARQKERHKGKTDTKTERQNGKRERHKNFVVALWGFSGTSCHDILLQCGVLLDGWTVNFVKGWKKSPCYFESLMWLYRHWHNHSHVWIWMDYGILAGTHHWVACICNLLQDAFPKSSRFWIFLPHPGCPIPWCLTIPRWKPWPPLLMWVWERHTKAESYAFVCQGPWWMVGLPKTRSKVCDLKTIFWVIEIANMVPCPFGSPLRGRIFTAGFWLLFRHTFVFLDGISLVSP